MFKVTPNPPNTDTSPYESLDSKKLHEAADRALDHYLKPPIPKATKRKPSTFTMWVRRSITKPCWSTPANPWRQPA